MMSSLLAESGNLAIASIALLLQTLCVHDGILIENDKLGFHYLGLRPGLLKGFQSESYPALLNSFPNKPQVVNEPGTQDNPIICLCRFREKARFFPSTRKRSIRTGTTSASGLFLRRKNIDPR